VFYAILFLLHLNNMEWNAGKICPQRLTMSFSGNRARHSGHVTLEKADAAELRSVMRNIGS
jgi:hypothetical protein